VSFKRYKLAKKEAKKAVKNARTKVYKKVYEKCWNFDFDDNICDADAMELYLKSLYWVLIAQDYSRILAIFVFFYRMLKALITHTI